MSDATRQDTAATTAPTQPPASSPTNDYDLPDVTVSFPPEPTPPPAAPAAAPEHPADLLSLAEILGFRKEDFADLSTSQARVLVNRAAAKQLGQSGNRDMERAANPSRSTESSPEVPAAQAAARPEQRAAATSAPESFLPEDDTVIDAEVAKSINGVFRKMAERIAALEGRTTQLSAIETNRRISAFDKAMDDAFSKLGEGYKAVIGDGPIRGLKDAEKERRALIAAKARRLAGDNAADEDIAAKVSEAAAFLYPQAPTAAPSEYSPAAPATPTPAAPAERPRDAATGRFTREQWNESATLAPTSRNAGPEKPGMNTAKTDFLKGMRDLDARERVAVNGDGDSME